jgi:hypothetical protein
VIDRYKVSDKEKQRLMKELKGDERKVKAIILLVEKDGYMTREQIANLVGVSRMTLWRWEQYDYIYQYELKRQYERRHAQFSQQMQKRLRKYTAAAIARDMRLMELIVLGASNV